MSEYRESLLAEGSRDVFKAAKILSGINHDLYMQSSCYVDIIRSCENILYVIAEELYQLAVDEAKKGEMKDDR